MNARIPLSSLAISHSPVADAGEPALPPRSALAPPIEAAFPVREPLRVLVVEDDADALGATLAALRALGHWATGVTSAESAIARYLPGAFDLLMLDVGLPGLSGQDLAAKLLSTERIAVIFASGSSPPARPPLGCAWLRKPYTLDELNNALTELPSRVPRKAP